MDETQTEQKPRTKILKNGAVYDLDRGRIVANPGGGTSAITSEQSYKYKQEMAEKKREALVRGAARTLERKQPGEWEMPSAMDVVEALGEAVMMKALNPDNPKQVDAARFILQEGGMAESQAKTSTEAQQFTDAAGAIFQLLNFLREEHQRDVVDGTATDIRNENDG